MVWYKPWTWKKKEEPSYTFTIPPSKPEPQPYETAPKKAPGFGSPEYKAFIARGGGGVSTIEEAAKITGAPGYQEAITKARAEVAPTKEVKKEIKIKAAPPKLPASIPLSVAAAKPFLAEERMRAWRAGYGVEESRPATIEERRIAGVEAGFEVAGAVAPTPTGRGTIIREVKDVREIPVGDIARGDLERAKGRIKYIQEGTAEKVSREIMPHYQSTISTEKTRLQLDVNEGKTSASAANKQLDNLTASLNKKLNQEIQTTTEKRLSQNRIYQGSLRRYISIAERHGITKDVYGKEILGKYQRTKKEIQKQQVIDIAEHGALIASSLPGVAAIAAPYFLAKAAAAGQRAPIVVERDIKKEGVPLYPKTEKTPEEIKYMAYGVLAGAGGAYAQFRAAAAGIQILNAKQIKTAELKRIKQSTLKRLGVDRKISVETAGTIREQQIIKERIIKSGAFQDKPEVIKLIQKAEIGVAKRINIKTGKIETRYIVKGSVAKAGAKQAGKEYLLTFKITKAGQVQVPRIAITDLKTGQTLVTRPAMPSELKTYKVAVKGQPPVEVSEIERMKIEQILKKRGVSKIAKQQIDDIILRRIEKKGVVFEIGKKARGTLTAEDILLYPKQKAPVIFKKAPPTPITKVTAREIQILRAEGLRARGFTSEKALVEQLEKPIIFDIKKIPKEPGAFDLGFKPSAFKSFKEYSDSLKQIGVMTAKKTQQTFSKLFSAQELGFTKQQLSKIPEQVAKEETARAYFGGLGLIIPKEKEIVSEIPAVKLQQQQVTRQKALQRELQKTEARVSAAYGLSTALSVKAVQILQQQQLQKQKLRLRQTQKLITQPTIPEYTYPTRKIYKDVFGGLGFPIPLGFRKEADRDVQQKALQRIFKQLRRKPAYAASLAAAAFQRQPFEITEKQLKKLRRKEFIGIEPRPVLIIKKRKQTEQEKALKKTIKTTEKGVIF